MVAVDVPGLGEKGNAENAELNLKIRNQSEVQTTRFKIKFSASLNSNKLSAGLGRSGIWMGNLILQDRC